MDIGHLPKINFVRRIRNMYGISCAINFNLIAHAFLSVAAICAYIEFPRLTCFGNSQHSRTCILPCVDNEFKAKDATHVRRRFIVLNTSLTQFTVSFTHPLRFKRIAILQAASDGPVCTYSGALTANGRDNVERTHTHNHI